MKNILNNYSFKNMSPEETLFRIAYTCAEGRHHRELITDEEHKILNEHVGTGKVPEWNFLLKVFGDFSAEAPKRLHKPIEKIKDTEIILNYFLTEHNEQLAELVAGKNKRYPHYSKTEANYCGGYIAKIDSEKEISGRTIYFMTPIDKPELKLPYLNMHKINIKEYDFFVVHKGGIALGLKEKN